MKNKIIFSSIVLSAFFLSLLNPAFASTTDGTIDPAYRYAWGENVGFVDFGSVAGNVHITDSTLSGSIYGENIGWVDLGTITNNSEGTLSGYAWGENIGWVDFSHVAIGSDGVFAGSVYGENIGWITFGTTNNKVATDWRPASVRGSGSTHHSSSGSSGSSVINPPIPTACKSGDNFSSTTGLPCAPSNTPTVCPIGHLFSATTGLPCTSFIITPLPSGGPSAPTCTLTSTLALGWVGPQVKCLQNILNLQPNQIPKLVPDGIFGPKTKVAVVTFQIAHNLKPDGIVGPLTRAKLNIIK